MTDAPDPGLTDLIAAHTLRVVELNEAVRYPECNGCDWVGGLVKDHAVHLASVVEQHTNGRITELEAAIARVREIRCGNCNNPLSEGSSNCVSDAGRPHIYDEADLRAALEGEQQ